MRWQRKVSRFPIAAKLWLASWAIFISLLPWQTSFAAMSCLWTANATSCSCESHCSGFLKKQPDSGDRVHSHTGQTGIPHQVLRTFGIGDTLDKEFPCAPGCSLQLPHFEAQSFLLQQQKVTEVAGSVQNQNVVNLLRRSQPTSHSPPRLWRCLPLFLIFSSLLI